MSIFALHHLIPRSLRNHPVFKGLTIGIDSLENQIYLPVSKSLASALGIVAHRGRHLGVYRQAIKEVLDGILEDEDLGVRDAKIRNLLDAMRIGFRRGHLYTNRREGLDIGAQREAIRKFIHAHADYTKQDPTGVDELRQAEERARELDQPHLTLWHAVSGDSRKEQIILDAIKSNPSEYITAQNKNLKGTFLPEFAAIDDHFETPPSTPYDPSKIPSLPPLAPPPVGWLNQPEGFSPGDPRFAGALPAFPQLDPNDQRLGQLPPTTAAPSDPQVFLYDPFTGVPNPGAGPSPILNPGTSDAGMPPAWLYAGAGLAALAALFPAMWPYLAALGAGYAATVPAHAAESESGTARNGITSASTAASPNAWSSGNSFSQSGAGNSFHREPSHPDERHGQAPETGSSFADRFGAWTDTPNGSVPEPRMADPPVTVTAGAVSSDELRRLTRSNALNAGSVFTFGSAPIPHLPSTKSGNGNVHVNGERSGQSSQPIGALSGEPAYVSPPPPVFGVEASASPALDAERWFARWIRPHLGPQ